jgi:hypothetical protein
MVYEFLVDTDNFRLTDAALIDYTPHGMMAVGTAGTMRHRRGGMTVTTRWDVAQLVPGLRIVVCIRGMGYDMQEAVDLVDSGSGTEVRVVDSLTGTSLLGRAFVSMSKGFLRRDIAARGLRMRAALEDHGGTSPGSAREAATQAREI